MNQLLFQPLALADIAHKGDREQPLSRIDMTEAHLGGELRAVFTTAGQIHADSHGAHARPREVLFARLPMCRTQGLGEQHLDARSEEFLAGVAEHFLGLAVGQDDFAIPTDGDNRLGGRFEQGRHHVLAVMRRSRQVLPPGCTRTTGAARILRTHLGGASLR